jgi:hypothetical protein
MVYQCRGLLPSLSGTSKSAWYFTIRWFKKAVCPYCAATWTACMNHLTYEIAEYWQIEPSLLILLKIYNVGLCNQTEHLKAYLLSLKTRIRWPFCN